MLLRNVWCLHSIPNEPLPEFVEAFGMMGRRGINNPQISQDQNADNILFWNQEAPFSRRDNYEQKAASQADLTEKVNFDKLLDDACAYMPDGHGGASDRNAEGTSWEGRDCQLSLSAMRSPAAQASTI